MAREGVTYEQIKAAAEELVSEGREPTIRAVRERLRGTGSPNTIHRHLTKWRDARPDAPAATADLPASILREINSEIQRAVSAARADIESQLARALTEAADLAAAGEALEAERDALSEQVSALTSDRDVLAGKAAEQLVEIERLGHELERERRAAEDARIEIAQGRLKLEAQTVQLAEQRAQLDQQDQDLRAEQRNRIAAERDLASVSASRDGLAERLQELHGREQTALREVADLRAQADQHVKISNASTGDVARLQEALSRVTDEASRLRAETVNLRDQLNASSVENARLTGLMAHKAPTRSRVKKTS